MSTVQPLVTVVIPHWNNKSLLDDCLGSLRNSTYQNVKVIVVDNASTDDSVNYLREKYPWVEVSERIVNGGYAAALNTGILVGYIDKPKYYFALNNDTILEPETIADLVKVMESNEEIGISAPLVLYESDPTITFSLGDRVYKWLPLPIRFGLRKKDKPKNHRIIEFDYVFGCAMLVRTSLLKKIGLFDDAYFMFFEDADICRRSRDAGFRIVRVGSTSILHKASKSVKEEPDLMVWVRARNRIFFYRKFRHGFSHLLTHVGLSVGSIFFIGKLFVTGNYKSIKPYVLGTIAGYSAKLPSKSIGKI